MYKMNYFTGKNIPEIYFAGIPMHDKSYLIKLNRQLKELGVDDTFKFSKKTRDQRAKNFKANFLFNYDVQVELSLIEEKCENLRLNLTLYYDKKNLKPLISLLIHTENSFHSIETNEYIMSTLKQRDTNLIRRIFIHGLASNNLRVQKDIFSSRYSLNYDDVDKRIACREFDGSDFKLQLTNRTNSYMREGSWFQVVDKKEDGSVYLRLVSDYGKRTYATLWLNMRDRVFLKDHLVESIEMSRKQNVLNIIRLMFYSEQKSESPEILIMPVEQFIEFIDVLDDCFR